MEGHGAFQQVHDWPGREDGVPGRAAAPRFAGSITLVVDSLVLTHGFQGKGAKTVMARLAPSLDLSKMNFMTGTVATVAGETAENSM